MGFVVATVGDRTLVSSQEGGIVLSLNPDATYDVPMDSYFSGLSLFTFPYLTKHIISVIGRDLPGGKDVTLLGHFTIFDQSNPVLTSFVEQDDGSFAADLTSTSTSS